MQPRVERLRVGPYRLSRQLSQGPLGERWAAIHEQDQSVHVAHRFKTGKDSDLVNKIGHSARTISVLSHPHLLPIEACIGNIGGSVWVVNPFTGNHDGLVTLESLIRAKGGRMTPAEAERALVHILEAIGYAHGEGCHHGPMHAGEVLVDRRGSLTIELYGLRRMLTSLSQRPASEIARDEVRSVAEIGYFLVTGLSAEDPRIAAGRMFPRLDKRWDEWFNEGLDPLGGFGTAEEALAGLPGMRREVESREKISPVQTVFRRMRQALSPL